MIIIKSKFVSLWFKRAVKMISVTNYSAKAFKSTIRSISVRRLTVQSGARSLPRKSRAAHGYADSRLNQSLMNFIEMCIKFKKFNC